MGSPNDVPGIGWALGVERMMALLDKSVIPGKARPVAVIPIFEGDGDEAKAALSQELLDASLKISQTLREAGIFTWHANNQIWSETKEYIGVKKLLARANKMNCKHVIFLGCTEKESNSVIVKNLDTEEQQKVDITSLAQFLKSTEVTSTKE
eukprot:TRINITY_DN6790_c0_g1_i1.p4 TRINITY_DN6790_c0_g1~~TRINITY_DN6790_c0_g1_i1.p4  ORF type:complete len:152 (+),score=33.69 TRINITY_DN6790_c0_g1_i1:2177-2632(+)